MATHPSHRSNWSDEHVRQLIQGFADGVPPRDLARALGRTEEAVRRKQRLLAKGDPVAADRAYYEGRAEEERQRGARSEDPRVKETHERMARYYDDIIAGKRDALSKDVE